MGSDHRHRPARVELQLFLNAIERSGPDEHGYFDWTLAGDHFSIGLSAPGCTQYLRHAPIHSPG